MFDKKLVTQIQSAKRWKHEIQNFKKQKEQDIEYPREKNKGNHGHDQAYQKSIALNHHLPEISMHKKLIQTLPPSPSIIIVKLGLRSLWNSLLLFSVIFPGGVERNYLVNVYRVIAAGTRNCFIFLCLGPVIEAFSAKEVATVSYDWLVGFLLADFAVVKLLLFINILFFHYIDFD